MQVSVAVLLNNFVGAANQMEVASLFLVCVCVCVYIINF
jgi:hypothetical protein